MSNLIQEFGLLLNSSLGQFGGWNIPSIVFGVIGASCFLSAFLPQIIGTYKSKNTVGANKLMFILHLVVGVLFFYGAVLLTLFGYMNASSFGQPLMVVGTIFTLLNFTTSMGCLYIVLLKSQNAKEAERLGITELEHYQRICVPYIQNRYKMEESVASEGVE